MLRLASCRLDAWCSALPSDWLERLENRPYLIDLANRLADKKGEMSGASQPGAGLV